MAQVNVEIPDWLNEKISEQAVRLKGKAGWKQHLVTAALIAFMKLPETEQKQRILAAQDYEAAERELRDHLERGEGGGGRRRGQSGR